MRAWLVDAGDSVWFTCPGCGENHGVTVAAPGVSRPSWTWNGRLDLPTFSPSILSRGFQSLTDEELNAYVAGAQLPVAKAYVCHSFVTDGRIQFLSDCTHALAGQSVDLPEINHES